MGCLKYSTPNKKKILVMANMSYCRFTNTLRDFQDCVRALQLDGLNSLSPDELFAADKLRNLCDEFIQTYDDEVEYEDD